MFSIIIPVYNRADLLGNAIDSVLEQSFEDWELIVVDDGSEDDIEAVIARYDGDPKIRFIRRRNAGVSAARNTGLMQASGKYIAFLDSDDRWLPNHLSVLADMAEKYPDAGFLGTWAEVLLKNGRTIEFPEYFENRPETIYIKNFYKAYDEDKRVKMFQMSTSCISAEAIERVGNFVEGCKIGEDLDITLRVAAYFPFVLTSRKTALYNHMESVATKDSAFDVNWCFFDKADELLSEGALDAEKRDGLCGLMSWFEMRRCRHCLLEGNRKEAYRSYKRIRLSKKIFKDQLINTVLLCMPLSWTRAVFSIRWRGQA